jgi:hypothetical protein
MPNRTKHADGDFAICDQLREVGQGDGNRSGVLPGGVVIYAAGSIAGGTLAAMF